MASVNIDTVIK